ncbi:MAG TPA: hypothetical protein VJ350_00045 [Methanoregula sp.]|nr:hypothetical protein [Methanoregula sp.]
MPFRSADMPVQVRFTVFPVRPGECDLFVVSGLLAGQTRKLIAIPAALRYCPP